MHDGLYEAEKEEKLPLRIAFAGLWCAADREGRFKWEPRRLGAQILPYDGIDFSRVLDALTTRAFIVKYRVGDACFGAIPSWKKHQIINNRERESEIPNYTDGEQLDACPTRAPRVPHASKEEGKGREGNKEGKEAPAAPLPFASEKFSEAWSLFRTHRSQIKKPLTPAAEQMQLKQLGLMGETRAIIAIEHTIAKGWQGIREPEKGEFAVSSQAIDPNSYTGRYVAEMERKAEEERKAQQEGARHAESMFAPELAAITNRE